MKINFENPMMYQHRIYYLSKRYNLTRKELAHKAEMTERELKNIMTSEVPNITLEQTAKLAKALNTKMNYLMLGI